MNRHYDTDQRLLRERFEIGRLFSLKPSPVAFLSGSRPREFEINRMQRRAQQQLTEPASPIEHEPARQSQKPEKPTVLESQQAAVEFRLAAQELFLTAFESLKRLRNSVESGQHL
jgi:hypothetical protein